MERFKEEVDKLQPWLSVCDELLDKKDAETLVEGEELLEKVEQEIEKYKAALALVEEWF